MNNHNWLKSRKGDKQSHVQKNLRDVMHLVLSQHLYHLDQDLGHRLPNTIAEHKEDIIFDLHGPNLVIFEIH